ncbi:hypothetical protein N7U66_03685 [Lacinutrix neustonica]|uniref:Uncharacterized protein n=1 Tax=Lacinutrix neustonica TaxID=2980107 RepID=A0A9E8MXE7_9FLAO|nr:hypothetical protein [Lacinutrix neustonica]WAC02776.1 hypothetical protein N7U66_03685 [Lacinutrix neustonica]
MKGYKKTLLWILSIILIFLLFITWYQYEFSMDPVTSFYVNSGHLSTKLLIATQGSDFKNAVTAEIIDHYKQDSVYMEIIDVSELNHINPEDYTALVIIHTWEKWKPPLEVKTFVERTSSQLDKIIVLTTSGSGDSKMKTVDAITGESRLENVTSYSSEIITRLEPILKIRVK